MTPTEINERLSAIAKAMVAKGMRQPSAECSFKSDARSQVYMHWTKDRAQPGGFDRAYKFITVADDGLLAAFAEADAFVAGQPNIDERRKAEFMAALGGVIDLGRENHIEVEFLNPLIATAKKLAENAITHQPA